MLKPHNETGSIIHANAENFGDELRGIAAISDLLSTDVTDQGFGESKLTDFRRGALLDGIKALGMAAYERLVLAVGNEDAFVVGTVEASKKEKRK